MRSNARCAKNKCLRLILSLWMLPKSLTICGPSNLLKSLIKEFWKIDDLIHEFEA